MIKIDIESLDYENNKKLWQLFNLSNTPEVIEESKDIFIEFVEKYKLDRGGKKSWRWLIGKYEKAPTLENGTLFDHCRYFITKDNRKLYISHPYRVSPLGKDIATIIEWCEQRGVKATIHEDSWYYPGKCYCIVFEKEE
jgi:hypothetical protein